ncbi:type II secretion system protein N [Sphingoaurantiacus capsulatus]|uniref:Type II secretion system protein N n=1 Tax=Sphingoaurantiacus capsulatus TaxID=1771310 RepID=A0ABV7X691_9SPHN
MLLRFDERARRLLKELPHRYAYTGAELLLLTFVALQLARLVWTVATPVEPLGNWRAPAPTAAPAEAPVLREFDPFFRTASDSGPVAVTSLNLSLLGTRVDTVSGRGSAILDVGGTQQSFLVNEEVMPGVKLQAVDFDSVTIARGDTREKLYLDQSAVPSTPPVTPGNMIMPDIATQGAAVQVPPPSMSAPPPVSPTPQPVPAQ